MNRRHRAGLALLWAILITSCGVPRPAAEGAVGASFPHPEGYEFAHDDGSDDRSTCGACHGLRDEDPVAGAPTSTPSCRSCHVYPHPASMTRGDVHGQAWTSDASPCAACHGGDGKRAAGGTERGRCTSCHSTYPHPPNWEAGIAHGRAEVARGAAVCAGCHGADGEGVPQAPCSECHADHPHPGGFAAASSHGAAWTVAPGSCDACHTPHAAVPGRIACASCHDLFPHPDDWRSGHLAAVQSRGRAACVGCHSDGLEGPTLPGSCGVGCHDRAAP